MLRREGALSEHTEGLVDIVRSIQGVEIAACYYEVSKNRFKISLRSKGKVNVEQVARKLGGGGHANASACRIEGKLQNSQGKRTRRHKRGVYHQIVSELAREPRYWKYYQLVIWL